MHDQAPRMQVKCGVSNCEFWHESHCDASALEVNPKSRQSASSSSDTECTTFRPGK